MGTLSSLPAPPHLHKPVWGRAEATVKDGRAGVSRRRAPGPPGRGEVRLTWPGESAESRDASELTEEGGEAGSSLVWISGGRQEETKAGCQVSTGEKGKRFRWGNGLFLCAPERNYSGPRQATQGGTAGLLACWSRPASPRYLPFPFSGSSSVFTAVTFPQGSPCPSTVPFLPRRPCP